MWHDLFTTFAASCSTPNFFKFPSWYTYLGSRMHVDPVTNRCDLKDLTNQEFIQSIPLIALAFVDIGLRIAALVSIGYVIWGGIQFIIAQGESDRTKKARQTIINALIGLVIALIATAIVTFVGSRIK
jgi:hypothetical protein